MPGRKALITGITGQDGSFLAELLLSLGYELHALRRSSAQKLQHTHIAHIQDRITFHEASLDSYSSIVRALEGETFEECYHLAAQSSVATSFVDAFATMKTNVDLTHYLLAAIRTTSPQCRFFLAASSEMFGEVHEHPQNEDTSFRPRSIYGVSKVAAYDLLRYYRAANGMYCAAAILFNHESPRRGEQFVTRKITRAVAEIQAGLRQELRLGNLDAERDWGHASDYVAAMHRILQQPSPSDYVIATGVTHSVREFCEVAFGHAGLNYQRYVVVDPQFFRPTEVHALVGDASKAHRELGWQPRITFKELVKEMVDHDIRALEKSRLTSPRP